MPETVTDHQSLESIDALPRTISGYSGQYVRRMLVFLVDHQAFKGPIDSDPLAIASKVGQAARQELSDAIKEITDVEAGPDAFGD